MGIISNIGNGKFVNVTAGECRVTVVGENMATHELDIYTALMSVPDTGISLPLDTMIGRTREFNDIYNTKGSYAGSTTGNEMLVDKNTTMSFKDDFVYLSSTPAGIQVNKSILVNMLMGEVFGAVIDDAASSVKIKPAGTNGAIKRLRSTSRGLSFGKLFELDGKFVVPQASTNNGDGVYEDNSRISVLSTTVLTVMIEFLYEYDANNKEGYRFVYASPSNMNFTEGDDANTISVDMSLPCDVRYIEQWFVDGPTETGKFDEDQYEIVTGTVDTAAGLTQSANGVAGTVGIVYNTTASSKGYSVFIHNGGTAGDETDWTAVFSKVNAGGTGVETGENKFKVLDFDFTDSKFKTL